MKKIFYKFIIFCFVLIMSAFTVFCSCAEEFNFGEGRLNSSTPVIYIDGELVDISGYLINGNNYFKLRDIAKALKNTVKCFQIEYNAYEKKVNLIGGISYTDDGTENYKVSDDAKDKVLQATTELYYNGEKLSLESYNINGNNYVKLREVAQMLDFAIMYYHETKTVSFVTSNTYAMSQEFYPKKADKTSENNGAGAGQGNETIPSQEISHDDYNKDIIDKSGLFSTNTINDYSKYFTNFVDGYRIMISKSMNVDMSISGVRTVLSNENMSIEIYDQQMSNGDSFQSYVNYGNKFIEDSSAYNKYADYDTNVGGFHAHVLEWSRPALSKVNKDKHFYASVDVHAASDRILTFLFKSRNEFETIEGAKYYINILNTLSLNQKTAAPVNLQKMTVYNPYWDTETRALYNEYFVQSNKTTWGIFQSLAPYSFMKLDEIEAKLNTKFKFLIYYTNINSDVVKLEKVLSNAAEDGRTVELTLQTIQNSSGSGNMLMDVLDGKYDDFLNQYAKIIASSGKPVLFRLANEMNGDWCMYSAYHTSKDTELYKEFYKYVYNIFKANGALRNTIWVWNPNWRSYPDYDWNHALCYYPGDGYVDVVGLTAYNTGNYYSGEKWSEFQTLYDEFYYHYCAWFTQPLMITEFACSSYGGDKAQWVRNMLSKIRDYNKIKVAIWWSGCDFDAEGNVARPYFIDDNLGVIEAFRNYFSQSN